MPDGRFFAGEGPKVFMVHPDYHAASARMADLQTFFVPGGGILFNPCTGEFVGFAEGAGFRVVLRTIENDNGYHLGFHENGVRLSGPGFENDGGVPGDPTGTRYQGMLSINERLNVTPPFPQTYTLTYRVIIGATGGLPNLVYTERMHVTVNANGEVTAEVGEPISAECRG